MFSVDQKRQIADAVQKILRDTNHPELPVGEIQFHLHVNSAEPSRWADIQNNGAVANPLVAYQRAIGTGVKEMERWMVESNVTMLPDDAWDLPRDCPLWGLGLSMAQLSLILAGAKRRLLAGATS